MQLLTEKDLAYFDNLVTRWVNSEMRDQITDLRARIAATKEYLARIEFATDDEIAAARDTHYREDGNFAVDDDARVSRCDDGECWVEAWVLIGKKQ